MFKKTALFLQDGIPYGSIRNIIVYMPFAEIYSYQGTFPKQLKPKGKKNMVRQNWEIEKASIQEWAQEERSGR